MIRTIKIVAIILNILSIISLLIIMINPSYYRLFLICIILLAIVLDISCILSVDSALLEKYDEELMAVNKEQSRYNRLSGKYLARLDRIKNLMQASYKQGRYNSHIPEIRADDDFEQWWKDKKLDEL